ncbi:MAG TPA: nickel pincer cofactor biosynthesis protein LarB [Phycisphaerales bacterium]|nr:nickel pincer cofactor biosynthesis protein LarB [Phycisphaerales bacterium]
MDKVRTGEIRAAQAQAALMQLPFDDLDFAGDDHHRQIRCGMPELIYCPGKTIEQIVAVFSSLAEKGNNVIAAKADERIFDAVLNTGRFPRVKYDKISRTVSLEQKKTQQAQTVVPIIISDMSDLPIASEVKITAEMMGQPADIISDVGIAGLHNLFMRLKKLKQANVIIAAAAEGSLASVIGGLVDCPIIAVPVSSGTGANFSGIAPLLTMLNSSAGVSVVGIDNGFAAAVSAVMINKKIEAGKNVGIGLG